MLTVHAGYMTLCSSIAILVAGVGYPSASSKILVDISFVCMNWSPTIHVWDLHAVSHSNKIIDHSSTPCLILCYISRVCLWCAPLHLVHGWLRQSALSLSMWWGGRENCTLRLPLLASVGLILDSEWAGIGAGLCQPLPYIGYR